MNELQNHILDVFKEFQRVCEEYNLRYYAIGGTCLGAIRHKGFIPWDDDIDVAMPWEDYQKLRRHWREMLSPNYEILDYETVQHFEVMFLKLFNANSTFIEERVYGQKDRYTGVFIDIMPIVGFPNDAGEQKHQLQMCNGIAKLNASRRFEVRLRPTIKSKIFTFLAKPLLLTKPFNYFSSQYDSIISQHPFGESDYIFFPWRIPLYASYKNVFPYKYFQESLSVPFEDTEIYVPAGYDKYLTMDFGNYMQFPPEDKRHGGHNAAIVDFQKPVREYQEVSK